MPVVAVVGQTKTLQFSLLDSANAGKWKAAPNIQAGDFTIVINDVLDGNVDNIPTVSPAAGRRVKLIVSAAETTSAGVGGTIYILGVDAAGAEWDDIAFAIDVVASDVAETGANGDTLETLSDQIDVVKELVTAPVMVLP